MGPRTATVGVLLALTTAQPAACASGDARHHPEGQAAASALREHRAEVRDLLADLARTVAVSRAGTTTRAELRGSYEGCASDALGQGYRSWTYAGGGRVRGDASLGEAQQALVDIGAVGVVSTGREVRASRRGIEVAVTRHRGALVVSARARPCLEVPAEQQEAWLDGEEASLIVVDQQP